jgi:fructoselysine 6-kinase
MRIVGVGDNTVDKYLHLGLMFPGGNAVNVPVLAHRYGHDGSYIGCLGNDRLGNLILHALEKESINISHCRILDGPNAYCEVTIVDGERVFGCYTVGVRNQLEINAEDLAFIKTHDLTHTSIYSSIEAYLPALNDSSSLLSFDFSQEWSRSYLLEHLPFVDIAILSYTDPDRKKIEDLTHWIYSQGPKLVLVTLGPFGAYAYDGAALIHQESIETEALDSLGAGDAFAARFMVSYFEGKTMNEALGEAAQSASETCKYYGAFGYGVSF